MRRAGIKVEFEFDFECVIGFEFDFECVIASAYLKTYCPALFDPQYNNSTP